MRSSLSVVQEESVVRRASGHDFRRRGSCGSGRFLGVETESVSPKTQVVLASTVLAPVLLSGLFLVIFVPQMWWIFTTYGWISFPAVGLLASGLSGIVSESSGKQQALTSAKNGERELLGALTEYGELTPAQAAMETSLSVSEADEKLKELAEGGHLEVRVRGGGLFYSLWKLEGGDQR